MLKFSTKLDILLNRSFFGISKPNMIIPSIGSKSVFGNGIFITSSEE